MSNKTKLYVVTADLYDCSYGCEINLVGVYDNAEDAQTAAKKYYKADINEVKLNTTYKDGIYLGGYYE